MNYKKNKKINKDIVLVGFQTYEYNQYLKVKKEIECLSFECSIEKLEKLGVWFKPFYKGENTWLDLEDWQSKYYYIITLTDKEQIF